MRLPFFQSNAGIGVSISDSSIEMIEMRRRPNGTWEVVSVSRGVIEPGVIERGKVQDADRLAAALRAVKDAAKPEFKTNNVRVCLPDSVTYFHLFRLPGSLTEAEVATALSFQVEEVVPFTAEELIGDFSVLERTEHETVVQYAVALKETVAQFRAAVTRAGLQLDSLALEAQALSASLLAAPRKGKASLVADMGEHTTTLFIRDEKGLFATFTSVIAGAAMTDAIIRIKKLPREKAETLKRTAGVKGSDSAVRKTLLSAVGDIATQISHVASWYQSVSGNVVDELVLTGGTSLMPGLTEAVQAFVAQAHPDMKVRVGQTFARAAGGGLPDKLTKNHEDAFFAPAFGAVLPPGKGEYAFNFLAAAQRRIRMPRVVAAPRAGRTAKPSPLSGVARRLEGLPEKQKLIAAGVLIGLALIGLLSAIVWRVGAERKISADIDALKNSKGEQTPDLSAPQNVTVTLSSLGQENAVAARIVEIQVEQAVDVPPAHNFKKDAQAIGTVTLYDTTSTSQPLVANTRLLSETGVLFRLKDAVTVPANGSVEAQVFADQPGASGNIEASRFTIPGLNSARQVEVYAQSQNAMTGGIAFVGVVDQADLDGLADEAERIVRARLADALSGAAQGDEVTLPDLTQMTLLTTTTDAKVGDEISDISATVSFSLRSMVFSSALFESAVAAQAAESLGLPLTWSDSGSFTISEPAVESVADDLSSAELSVTAQFYPQPVP